MSYSHSYKFDMASPGTKDAQEWAYSMVDRLNEVKKVAIETQAGEENDGEPSLDGLVDSGVKPKASDALAEPMDAVAELAREVPTVRDEGEGNGAIHPAALKVLSDAGYAPNPDATGVNLQVHIPVQEDGDDTMTLRICHPRLGD